MISVPPPQGDVLCLLRRLGLVKWNDMNHERTWTMNHLGEVLGSWNFPNKKALWNNPTLYFSPGKKRPFAISGNNLKTWRGGRVTPMPAGLFAGVPFKWSFTAIQWSPYQTNTSADAQTTKHHPENAGDPTFFGGGKCVPNENLWKDLGWSSWSRFLKNWNPMFWEQMMFSKEYFSNWKKPIIFFSSCLKCQLQEWLDYVVYLTQRYHKTSWPSEGLVIRTCQR